VTAVATQGRGISDRRTHKVKLLEPSTVNSRSDFIYCSTVPCFSGACQCV
jgi:hypothetical protein